MADKGINLHLGPQEIAFLERRGAHSRRGGGTFSRTAVLRRSVQGLRVLLEEADPAQRLGPAVHRAAIALLPGAWSLKHLEIKHLEEVLEHADRLPKVLSAAKLDRATFLAAVAALSFPEKFALVDQAVQAHAPAAAGTRPEDG